jgi:hypothetical protein
LDSKRAERIRRSGKVGTILANGEDGIKMAESQQIIYRTLLLPLQYDIALGVKVQRT